MKTNDKTLADVQPGGRVRLGDQPERARFEAWNRENWPNLDLSRGPLGDYMQARVRSDWQLWQAALAARQPVGEPVEHACSNCDRKHAEVICLLAQASPGTTAVCMSSTKSAS